MIQLQSPAAATAKADPARVKQIAILAVVVTVVLAAATWVEWGTSTKNSSSSKPSTQTPTVTAHPSNPTPPPAQSAPPAGGTDRVEGLVQSVSGSVIQLRTRSGSATVDFTPSTRIIQVTSAQLTDVTVGSCVNVQPTQGSAPAGGEVSAQSVTISPAVDGKCLPQPNSAVYGTVASVSGNTIAVNAGGQTATNTVTVADSTTYSKQAMTDSQAIQQGKCMAAQGSNTAGGLQATTISLETCPPFGSSGHHHHLPSLPHLPIHVHR